MRYVKIENGTQWKGYLEVHETISGFSCFVCNDDRFERMLITRERAEDLHISLPKNYRVTMKNRDTADETMKHIAKLNGFTQLEDMQ